MTPRDYELFLTRSQKLAILGVVLVQILLPLVFIYIIIYHPKIFPMNPKNPTPFPWPPLAIFSIIGLLMAVAISRLPRKITVTSDHKLIFISYFNTVEVRISDILSIEPKQPRFIQMPSTMYLLKHQEGKLYFPGQFTEQYQLLYELKKFNPDVELKGC